MVSGNDAQIFHVNAGHFQRALFSLRGNSLKHLEVKNLRSPDKFSATEDMPIMLWSQRWKNGS